VIYEKLIAQDKSIQIQKLLFAENIKLTSHELTLVEDNKDMFTDIGFEIEIL
jgi:DNA mismatch repair ATPase MutL